MHYRNLTFVSNVRVVLQICSLASNRMILLGKSGWDRHLWDLEPKYFQQFLICAFVAKLTLVLGSVFCRLSLICFYYRLIRDSSLKWFHNVLHASLAMNTLIGVAFVFLLVFACTYAFPLHYMFERGRMLNR